MSTDSAPSLSFTDETTVDITTSEHNEPEADGCAGLALSDTAIDFIETEVNGGDSRRGDRIQLEFDRDGLVTLQTTSYVGVVSLPEGPVIEIRPKVTGTPLLHLLQYANGVDATTFAEETPIQQGNVFIEAIAALFQTELSAVLTRGLHTAYQTRDGTENRLRGRLNLQRQLNRQPPQPTAFECTYDELTPDVPLNQAILFATTVLIGLVQDDGIGSALQRHRQQLRQRVTLRPVDPAELRTIETTRLNEYYDDLLRLTDLILRNLYVSELAIGESRSYSLLVNMNTVFENAVGRAAKAAIADRTGWSTTDQDTSRSLDEGGRINLKPDFTIADQTNAVRLVGDAKWKTESPENDDFYQLAAYQSAFDAPGLVVYPNQAGRLADSYTFPDGKELTLMELPTMKQTDSFAEYVEALEESLHSAIDQSIGHLSR
ncbi:McrC family protein [Salinibaculum salinum]|uniref:McrC family protein n=1 Tax=Salinibaculum salinum TaxID=3131996 RepID=UPI0030EDE305